TWNGAGVAESRWRIPKEAKLGRYQVVLTRAAAKKGAIRPTGQEPLDDSDEETAHEWPSGQIRVEEFRVPLMRGVVRPPAEPLVAVSEFPVDLSVQYLAGGGASRQPVTLRTQVRPKSVSPPEEFENFTFANGPVKEGITRSGVADEDELDGEDEGAIRRTPKAKDAVHQREELVLDGAGTARATISRLPRATAPLDVVTELEFRDPNGEVQTVSSVIPLWPAHRLVGIFPDSWVASKENLRAKIAVIDVRGRPIAGDPVQIDLLERKSYSHRKRLVGGFYAYEHVAETRRVGELCRGETDATGLFLCEGTSPVSGNVVMQASVVDGSGNTSQAHREVWVAGSEEWWFEAQDSDRIDLLPEKRRYEPGETARLQVRMPFREATALVAVEREGVAEASVVSLSGKEPIIEVPVREDYAPNIFISVLAVRGRVSGVQPTALIDLGRPSFKLGVAEIRVGWRAHELRVKVSSGQTVYRVREKAAVKIAVQRADGQPLPSGSEIALAAVDEGLL
ncbi:MAG: alpha-2-macroglobulin, partial [Candidatus Methylomirabilaceae bacterium]